MPRFFQFYFSVRAYNCNVEGQGQGLSKHIWILISVSALAARGAKVSPTQGLQGQV